ncbi:hypothetical protein FB45DRAFT_1023065 [Roridomyces roridus]|uniref:Bacteriophage T5 Orf172 DNA-binding domain-containing protein n=1 Tax=Roridomyces roridus TaxID=1738132 RepID=A0AAD7C5G6_9AGAR|nr:hypothetical protein FB45DRAFT_1023065 [Roridomyces roridus]
MPNPIAPMDYRHSLPEPERVRILALMKVILASFPSLERAQAHLNLRMYKDDLPGDIYAGLEPRGSVKLGYSTQVDVRLLSHNARCGQHLWLFAYATPTPKLLESLIHLTLKDMGAHKRPRCCRRCRTRHREYFSEELDLGAYEDVIKCWLKVLGQPIERQYFL